MDGNPGTPPWLVPTEHEQREMHDRTACVFERMSTGAVWKDASLLAQMNDRVALVARSAMLDPVRDAGGRGR